MQRDVGVVVVAAGQGSRFGGPLPKQYALLAGQPVLLHAIRPFVTHPEIGHVVIVLPASDAAAPPVWLASGMGSILQVVAGGATRRDSVSAGLAALPGETAVVLVHDGARPFPSRTAIDAGIAAARDGHATVPALPVSDTLKRADQFGRVLATVPRDGLWRAQTPQAFPYGLLVRAHAADVASDTTVTDDAMLVELAGGVVDLLPGDPDNIKITTTKDLALAEWLLAQR